jgi:hypothetical protein
MRNTSDVTGGKSTAIWSQSISGVSAINPLVAFYDIHGWKNRFENIRLTKHFSSIEQFMNELFIKVTKWIIYKIRRSTQLLVRYFGVCTKSRAELSVNTMDFESWFYQLVTMNRYRVAIIDINDSSWRHNDVTRFSANAISLTIAALFALIINVLLATNERHCELVWQ